MRLRVRFMVRAGAKAMASVIVRLGLWDIWTVVGQKTVGDL